MIIEILIGCIVALIIFTITRKNADGMPPGEWGWPVIGYLPSLKVPLIDYIESFKKKYGKTFTWRMGSRTFVFICDFKVLKAAFNNPLLIDRPKLFSLVVFSDFKRIGFVNSNGIPWQNLRRFSLRHLRDSGMGKSSLEDVIDYEVGCLVQDFVKHTDKVTEIPWSMNTALHNVLWGIIAGKHYELEDKKFQEFEKLVAQLLHDEQSISYVIYDLFPWISQLIPITLKRKLGLEDGYRRIEEYKNFLMETIIEHQEKLEEDKPGDYIDSYLIEMKQHAEGRGANESTSTFSIPELLYTLSDLYGGGSETTSATIRWLLVYMIKYPEIQKKIQQQIDDVVPRDRFPGLQDREKLAYVDATFYEVMRIKTIFSIGLYHSARDDTYIEDFRIPKGTIIVPAFQACHLDPDYWEEPEEFNPDRFLLPNGSIDSKKEGFLPFSIGRRACPGESLTRMTMFLFAAALLQKFSFSAPEGVDLILEPDPLSPIFTIPKPFKLLITERK